MRFLFQVFLTLLRFVLKKPEGRNVYIKVFDHRRSSLFALTTLTIYIYIYIYIYIFIYLFIIIVIIIIIIIIIIHTITPGLFTLI